MTTSNSPRFPNFSSEALREVVERSATFFSVVDTLRIHDVAKSAASAIAVHETALGNLTAALETSDAVRSLTALHQNELLAARAFGNQIADFQKQLDAAFVKLPLFFLEATELWRQQAALNNSGWLP